jgi:hypothetical protein
VVESVCVATSYADSYLTFSTDSVKYEVLSIRISVAAFCSTT